MSTLQEQTQLLDQLQTEVNRIVCPISSREHHMLAYLHLARTDRTIIRSNEVWQQSGAGSSSHQAEEGSSRVN